MIRIKGLLKNSGSTIIVRIPDEAFPAFAKKEIERLGAKGMASKLGGKSLPEVVNTLRVSYQMYNEPLKVC